MEAAKLAIKILAKVIGVRTEAPSNLLPPPSPVKAASDPNMKAMQTWFCDVSTIACQEIAMHLKGPSIRSTT